MSAINKIAIAVFLLFTSAANAQPAAPKPGGNRICVASALGQRYDVQTIGLMVFGNNLQSVSVESWGIDEMVVRKTGAILGTASRCGGSVFRKDSPTGRARCLTIRMLNSLRRSAAPPVRQNAIILSSSPEAADNTRAPTKISPGWAFSTTMPLSHPVSLPSRTSA